jgi:hypothetical protein
MEDTDKIDEVYTLLENNDVIIPKHIKNLFNKLNLVGLRGLACIKYSQFVEFEDAIKEILVGYAYYYYYYRIYIALFHEMVKALTLGRDKLA